MSVVVAPSSPVTTFPLAWPPDFVFRLSVEQYHEMIRAGILTDDDRVEFLEGWLIAKMPKNPRHSFTTQLLREKLERLVPSGWFVNGQEPITVDTSEPEPDAAIIRGQRNQYLDHHPMPADVALVVEVADTTLQRDRGLKKRIYARVAIPVYWIVNLQENQIEVYTDPTGPVETPDYRQRQDFGLLEAVPIMLEGQETGRLGVQEIVAG